MRLRNIPHADGVIQSHKAVIKNEEEMKGHWNDVFHNDHPIHIEIGMGKGQFLLEMAATHPEINYIGIERYTSVLLRATEKFDTEEYCELQNIRFICMDARDLDKVFELGEIEKIYLNFSDPWPKARHAKRRLTSRTFLKRYESVLLPGSYVEFKTDNTELFKFSLEEAGEAGWRLEEHTFDLHNHPQMKIGNIMTEYEAKFSSRGQKINKMIIVRP